MQCFIIGSMIKVMRIDLISIIRFHLLGNVSLLPIELLQYGCQCQITTNSSVGASQDVLDESCVEWHQCRTCVMIEQNLCDPKSSMYEVGVNVTSKALSCDLTESYCERITCQCDLQLVKNLMNNISKFNRKRVAHRYHHRIECVQKRKSQEVSLSNIVRLEKPEEIGETEKPRGIGNEDNDFKKVSFNHKFGSYDMCCGAFPHVRPFSSMNGKRQCCGDSVYNQKTMECCQKDVIVTLGTC